MAGGSGHDPLRARVLGLLQREHCHQVTLLRILPHESARAAATRQLEALGEDLGGARCVVEVDADPIAVILRHAREFDNSPRGGLFCYVNVC